MRRKLTALLALVSATTALGGEPPTIETLVLEGDPVAGVGNITRIDNIIILDDGTWAVEADTDNADGDADSVVLLNGALFAREGDPLALPAGASIDSFGTVTLNNFGEFGWNLFLDGTGGFSDDSGIFVNTTLIIQEGFISTSDDFGPNTPYIGFFGARLNDNGQMLLMASVDDPNIDTSVDRALVILELDDIGGFTENVFLKEDDSPAGILETIDDFGTSVHEYAFNNNGDIMYLVELSGDSATDGAVYLNDTLLAREGSDSPIEGRPWDFLTSSRMDVNENGDVVFSGGVEGDTASDNLIAVNGEKLVQEGDPVPGVEFFIFTSFGSGPVYIDANQNVLWYGDWNDPNTDFDTGLFLNDTLLVQEGVSMVDGVVIDTLRGIQEGYYLSESGQYVIFEAILDDGNEGAFLIELAIDEEIVIASAVPADDTVDARQTSDPDGQSVAGIGSADEPITITLAPAVSGEEANFSLCETDDGGMGPNGIASVTETLAGTYEIVLNRPITAGAVTTISHAGGSFVSYTYHPANTNADSAAGAADVLFLIDVLGGQANSPHGEYSEDIDRSGVTTGADVLRVIDLLNGAGVYEVWNLTTLPVNDSCP